MSFVLDYRPKHNIFEELPKESPSLGFVVGERHAYCELRVRNPINIKSSIKFHESYEISEQHHYPIVAHISTEPDNASTKSSKKPTNNDMSR